MKEMSVLIMLIGCLLCFVGPIMLYVNYRMGRPTKKSWIISVLGAVLVLTIVFLNDAGKI